MVYLILKPFLGQRRGPTAAETLSRGVEHAELKDSAAALTQVGDAMFEQALAKSQADRLVIQPGS